MRGEPGSGAVVTSLPVTSKEEGRAWGGREGGPRAERTVYKPREEMTGLSGGAVSQLQPTKSGCSVGRDGKLRGKRV